MNKKAKPKLSKKKKIILSVISIILILCIVAGIVIMNNKNSTSTYSYIRTTTLSKGTFDDSFSSTGTVKSAKTSNVTTDLNYAVKTINVSVGDKVKKGDVIATLDTSQLTEQIEREESNLSSSKTQAQSSYSTALSNYNKAKSELSSAKQTLSSTKTAYNSAKTKYQNVKSAVSSYQSSYDKAYSNYEKSGVEYVKTQSAYLKAVSSYKKGSISSSKLVSAAQSYMTATQNYLGGCSVGTYSVDESSNSDSKQGNASSGVSVSQTASTICNEVVSTVKSLAGKILSVPSGSNTLLKASQKLSSLQTAKQNCNYSSVYSSFTSAKNTYKSAKQNVQQLKSNLSQMKSSLSQAKNELENASSSDTLEELKTELAKCTLTAGQSGTVTALNATVGSSAQNGNALATISNLDKLKVSITIEEAYINNATVGMSCYITSDASDETLNGTLTQIDPTASDSGSFGAEVTVDSQTDDLKVGMNATVQLLVSTKDGVYQVPIDAVGSDDSGDYVYRKTSGEGTDMQFEKVYITKGESNDYYVEISSDSLADGDIIRSSADLTQGIESGEKKSSDTSSIFSSLFGSNKQGGGGGDAPGGNGNSDMSPPSGGGGNSGSSGGGAPSGNPPGGSNGQ